MISRPDHDPSGHWVLVVDDNDLNRTLVRTIVARSLPSAGAPVLLVEAGSLAAAREALTSHPVELVLLDLTLPDGHGLDLAREVAAGRFPSRPVVVAVTADDVADQRRAAAHAGCDDFLAKPFRPHQLVDLLAGHIRDVR